LGYPVREALPAVGAEADLFVLQSPEGPIVLRLYREGRAPKPEIAAKLQEISRALGDQVVKIIASGLERASGRSYELLEYLPLGDLAALLKSRGRLETAETRLLASSLGGALDAMHKRGLIHRDLKPANILIRSLAPLQVAIGDFGISSLLPPNASVKATRLAHTPLYGAPESFADFAGEAGDFWSLGAVLLECLWGSHPLAHLSLGVVAREILSRGLKIPKDIPPRERELLQGLLTRDDRKRWRHAEIVRWSRGEKDIPLFREESDLAPASRPQSLFRVGERYFASPEELARRFASGYAPWRRGAELLSRGSVADWLRKAGFLFELGETERELTGEADENLYAFIRLFAPDSGLSYKGLALSLANLKYLLRNHADLGEGESAVLSDILEARLQNIPRLSRAFGEPLEEEMELILASPKAADIPTLTCALLADGEERDYIWGPRGAPQGRFARLKFVLKANCPLLSWDFWAKNVPPKMEIPQKYLEGFAKPENYAATRDKLLKALENGAFRSRR
jgi:hypothetical protein